MKHLQDYIVEQAEFKVDEGVTSKSITFDFTDLENADETIESLKDKEGISVDDKKVTLEITADNVDKIGTAQDILQQFCQTVRKSQKVSSDEQYAQKTAKFEENVGKMNDAIDEIKNPDDDDDDDDKD
jgi:hypothetical protein